MIEESCGKTALLAGEMSFAGVLATACAATGVATSNVATKALAPNIGEVFMGEFGRGEIFAEVVVDAVVMATLFAGGGGLCSAW